MADAKEVIGTALSVLPDALKLLGAIADLCRKSGASDEELARAIVSHGDAQIEALDAELKENPAQKIWTSALAKAGRTP